MENNEKKVISEETEVFAAPGGGIKKPVDKKRRRGNILAVILLCLTTVWWVIGAPFFDFGWSHLPSTNTCYTIYRQYAPAAYIEVAANDEPDLLFDWKKSVIKYSSSQGVKEIFAFPLRIQLSALNFDSIIRDDYLEPRVAEMREHNVATWVYFESQGKLIVMHYFMIQDNGDLIQVTGRLNKYRGENSIIFELDPAVGLNAHFKLCGDAQDFYDYVEEMEANSGEE